MSDWRACVRCVGRKARGALALAVVLAGCGSTTVIEEKTETATATATAPATNTTTAQPPGPSSPVGSLPKHCSSGLTASEGVPCELANNVFYEYHKAVQEGRGTTALSAWSPQVKQYRTADCTHAEGVIRCHISGTSVANAQVEITQAALDAYTPQHASEYARTHDLGPSG